MPLIFSHKNRLAIICIPRVASTSIRVALSSSAFLRDRYGEQLLGTQVDNPGYFTAAFVRHPLDRLVSAIHCPGAVGPRRALTRLDTRDVSIDQHIEFLLEQDEWHVRPQPTFLQGHQIDFLGRFDRLEHDWEELRSRFDLPRLGHTNKGTTRPPDWRAARVNFPRWAAHYRDDFALCPDWDPELF